jgi:hypothetical protein
MKLSFRSLVVILCALLTGAALAQSPATTPVKKTPGAFTFSYDAQHDQVIPNGVELKPAAIGAVSLAPVTGTVVVTINISAVSHFKHGTTYHCSLTAIGGELDTTNGAISGGIDTATEQAHWTGTNALRCTLSIPYEWTLIADPAATRGAILAFGVAAIAPAADGGTVERSTLQVDGVEPLPPSGTTSTFAFNVTL